MSYPHDTLIKPKGLFSQRMQKSVGASGSSQRKEMKSWRDTCLVLCINDSRTHKHHSLCHKVISILPFKSLQFLLRIFVSQLIKPQQIYVATIS